MGFNLAGLGSAFKGQQEYDQFLQAKKMRDLQLQQAQLQQDPMAMQMAWDAMQNGAQGRAQVPPMPGQASVPMRPPPMPQAPPQMAPGGAQPPPPQMTPLEPYKPLPTDQDGPNQMAPDMQQLMEQGAAPPTPDASTMPPQPQAMPSQQPAAQQGVANPSSAAPVELKRNMSLPDAQLYIQQNYANASPAQKFKALEMVHGYMSEQAKYDFQEKTLEQKAKIADAQNKIKEMQTAADAEYKKNQGELKKAQADTEEIKRMLIKAQALGVPIKADAAKTTAEARMIAAQASASRAASAAQEGGDKLTEEGRAVRDARAMAGLPTYKTKRGQVDYELYNSIAARNPEAANDIVVKPAEYKANASSLAATQKRADAIELGSRKIPLDIATMLTTLDKGVAGSWRVTNEPINKLRTMFSDEDLRKFALTVKQVGTEYERLLTGGMLSAAQLHTGAAEDAKKLLNEDMSPKEIKAVIPIMLQEIKNAKTAADAQLNEIKGRMRGEKQPAGGQKDAGSSLGAEMTKERWDSMKSGDTFIDAQGNTRQKP